MMAVLMARTRSIYACTECGAQHPQWLGRCPECASWNSLVEEPSGADPAVAEERAGDLLQASASAGSEKPRRLTEIEPSEVERLVSGIEELDRVLGGGLPPGAVMLLGGEPGVGKSTLALQLAACFSQTALYVTGEEGLEQIRLRAERLGAGSEPLHVLAETRLEALVGPWSELQPRLVVIDSIQTLHTDRIESAPGSVAQVRECAARLAATARSHGTAVVLVGHVTKDGALAGPRVLEHLVDVVLSFDGDRRHALRLLRALKNRFGSTQEVGVFQMLAAGLQGVENPSELFLAERVHDAPGSCIVPLLEGTRPMLVEVQSLVAPAPYGSPRRSCLGIEDARLALLLAVLDRRSDVDLLSQDVYANATGGVRVSEPAADLGLALAIASSRLDRPVPPDVVACGEVGLGGEIRRASRIDLRAREAARLGFRRILVPRGAAAEAQGAGVEVVPLANVAEAVAWLRG